jgi:pantothenate kinase
VHTRDLASLSSKISTLESYFCDRSHFYDRDYYSIRDRYLARYYYLVESHSIEKKKNVDSEDIIVRDVVDNLVGDAVDIVEEKNIAEDIIDIIAR